MARLQGKRAVVTGAGSGIGRASAKLFAAEGAALLIVDKTAAAVEETAAQIRAVGGKVIAVAADAGAESEVRAFIDKAVRDLGGLDIVYANAGVSGGVVPVFGRTLGMWPGVPGGNPIGPPLSLPPRRAATVHPGAGPACGQRQALAPRG